MLESSAGAFDPPLDLVHLARQCLGDHELEAELLGLFRVQARVLTGQLSDTPLLSLESKAKIAHTLRGSALAVARARRPRGMAHRGIGLGGRRPRLGGGARDGRTPIRSRRGPYRNRPHSGLDRCRLTSVSWKSPTPEAPIFRRVQFRSAPRETDAPWRKTIIRHDPLETACARADRIVSKREHGAPPGIAKETSRAAVSMLRRVSLHQGFDDLRPHLHFRQERRIQVGDRPSNRGAVALVLRRRC